MAFFSIRKEKQLTQGEFIHPTLVVWEDSSALRSVSASHPLPVNVVSGGTSGEQYADGTPVDASHKGNLVLGTDGSNYQILAVDSDGHLQVDILSGCSFSTPSTIYNGKKTITTAGTAEALASSTAVKSVVIKALYSNTGKVYVGNSSVSSSNGVELEAGDAIGIDIDNLNKIYIDADNDGEGVSYIATN